MASILAREMQNTKNSLWVVKDGRKAKVWNQRILSKVIVSSKYMWKFIIWNLKGNVETKMGKGMGSGIGNPCLHFPW